MGSLYRSERVSLYQLFLQDSAAYACLSALGELGLVQFRDLNVGVNVFQRRYVNEVRRCEEMERRLRFLEKEIRGENIKLNEERVDPPAPTPAEIKDLEAKLEKLEADVKEVNANTAQLRSNAFELTELNFLLAKSQALFQERNQMEIQAAFSAETSTAATGPDHHAKLGFMAGVIARERVAGFERMLFRVCKGNTLLKVEQIEQTLQDINNNQDSMKKSAFVVFYQGDHLKEKVRKVCDGYRATIYNCPDTAQARQEMALGVQTRIKDLENIMKQTTDHKKKMLTEVSGEVRSWFMKALKVKGIYHTLNFLNIDLTQKCFVGECWIPDVHLDQTKDILRRAAVSSGSTEAGAFLTLLETKRNPPTYNRTNKFTKVFQGIVNSYGVSSYREVNPAPFTIISFPFLFSMMFGDIGHGLLVFLAGLVIVLLEKRIESKITDEISKIFFGGRYIVLLMGAFSIYAGFMYNDIFSLSTNIFGSAWYPNPDKYNQTTVLEHNKDLTLDPNTTDYSGHPYPFGMDPVWQLSLNKITFLNSFKMKLSIIFGISQMTFGVILSLQNHRYFNDPINIFCEFIPEMLFLMSIFGYLIVLIVYKWIVWDASRANCAPSLLIDLINMFLMNYPSEPCGSAVFYNGQKTLQTILILLVVICIPWLLVPKPLLLRRKHLKEVEKAEIQGTTGAMELQATVVNEKPAKDIVINVDDNIDEKPTNEEKTSENHKKQLKPTVQGNIDDNDQEEEYNFGDIFVHQCIHTIEFCLGCISHTASYLRLWALSLAHAELSEVLWTMVLHNGFVLIKGYAGVATLFIIFTPWAVLTVAILLLMEGLSAFLHTLRLHWVEFQSKFYKGEGYIFEPYSFRKMNFKTSED